MILHLLLSCALTVAQVDTLSTSVVTASVKRQLETEELATPVTSLTLKQIEASGIEAPKELSGKIPGLFIPDYGSAMTSTIYIRGIGSRMENPVMGLYVDDVPVIDKNHFDFSFLDIRRVDMMRGPQGTLYGRNSMLGVLSVETLSPKVWQGVRAGIEYGSANSLNVNASVYKGAFGAAVAYRHTDGFYTNEYTGKKCDPSDMAAIRLRYSKTRGSIDLDNSLSVSYTDQGGYPYRLYSDGTLNPVSYNDRSAYKRLSVMDGFRATKEGNSLKVSSVTSFQLLHDSMDLDQDFTPKSMFTMNQTQDQYVITQEVVFRPVNHPKWWDSQSGVFAFGKLNNMSAPVHFLSDGINSLILGQANAHIPEWVGRLSLQEDNFPITSDFRFWTYNVAAYHESYFRLGRWLLTAGFRLDHEGDFMKYDSRADIHFKMSYMSDFTPLSTTFAGHESEHFLQFLPKLSAIYDASFGSMSERGESLKFYASVSRGYKSGGFNSQIFSDILQNKMMNGMMEKLGMGSGSQNEMTAAATKYKPETCVDHEVGGRWSMRRAGHFLDVSANAFYVLCRNQQITVFPYGNGTGRMMANAGRSRSLGLEAELSWRWKGLHVDASAGITDARFKEYNDGREDYSDNRIPYSPSSTLYASAGYRFTFGGRVVRAAALTADITRTGKIFWDEAGELSQAPYWTAGCDLRISFPHLDFFVRGDNLTDTSYDVFYFKSVGNSFFQTGKPRRVTAGVSMEF